MLTITISGTPGSGKSTIGKFLEYKLKKRYIYSGEIFRETAKKLNMSLEEFGIYCESNNEIDQNLDKQQLKILKKGNIILEGRLAGWIAYRNEIPALKILITADLETRAKRIVKREKGSIEKRKKEIINREKSENTRYKKYYDIDLKDTSIYDLIIDSSDKNPEEIVTIIIKKIKDKNL